MIDPETLAREKILFAYTQALDGGDFTRLEMILEQASADPLLEKQILEINATLSQPHGEAAAPASAEIPAPNLLQWLKTTLANLISTPLWKRQPLFSAGVILAGLAILLVIGRALLGPAVGSIFTTVHFFNPYSANQPYERQNLQMPAAATQAPAATSAPAPTQSAFSNQSFAAAPTPTPYTGPHSDGYTAYPAPGSPLQPPAPGQPQAAERLIVRNANLSLVVKDTRLARQAVIAMIADYAAEGAFVVSADESYPTTDQMPVILMTLRVPVKRYDESMARLVALGIQVLQRQENAEDVTQAYVDVSGRVEALQTSRDRLLEIVKEAKNTEDLLRAEEELSRRESELEAALATQKYLGQTAALSSITLQLQPPSTSLPVTDNTWNPAATFRNAVRALLSGLRTLADGLIYFAVATLPWLVVLALLVYGAVRLFHKR